MLGDLYNTKVLGCQWRDLILYIESPKWCVRRTVKRRDNGAWVINNPKTEKAKRAIVLPQSLALVLRRLREQQEAEAENRGVKLNADDYLFIQ